MNIIKTIGIVFILNILEYIIAPFSTMIITKSLTVNDFGVYSLLLSMSSLIFSFFTLGLSQYNCKIVPGRQVDEQYSILGQSILCELISATIGIVIVVMFFFKKIDNNILLILFSVKTLLSIIINEIIRFFGYQKKNITKSVFAFFDARGWFLIILILFLAKKITISTIFIAQTINSLFILIVILKFLDKKEIIRNLYIKKTFITNVLKISISFVFIDVGMYLLEMASRYILSIEASMESVGLFSFTYSWISILFKFAMLVVYLLQPYFSEAFYKSGNDREYFIKFQKYTKIAFKYSMYIIFCAIILLYFYYEQIVLIIGKHDYISTYKAFIAMILLPLFMFFAYFFQIILLLAGKAKLFPVCYLIMGGVNIILNILLIKRFDYLGSAIVCTICYLLLSILFYIFCPKNLIGHLVSLKDVFKYVILLVLLIIGVFFFKKFITFDLLSLLVSFFYEFIVIVLIFVSNKNEILFLKEAK